METDRISPGPSRRPILDEITSLARLERAQAKSGELVIPMKRIARGRLDGVDKPLGEIRQLAFSRLGDCFRGSTAEAVGPTLQRRMGYRRRRSKATKLSGNSSLGWASVLWGRIA